MKYEEELQKLMTNQPKIKSLQAFWLSEAQKMIDYMRIRKIWKNWKTYFQSSSKKTENLKKQLSLFN